MGGEGDFIPMPRLDEVTDLDNGKPYPVITGDYSATPAWESRPVVVGTPIGKPTPVFTKFDPSVVDEEIARMRQERDDDTGEPEDEPDETDETDETPEDEAGEA
jgi:methionyl-tRNA synthetase